MIKFRQSALNSKEIEIERVGTENLQETFDRVWETFEYNDDKLKEYFEILVDGYIIDRELWTYTIPSSDSQVLIAITPKGGDFGQILGQVAIIAAIAVATAYTGGLAAGGGWGMAAAIGIRVGAAIGTTLLVNALIPPPDAGIGGTATNYDYSDSQMYAITGQSNKTNKYGTVPKVYGTHRMFPIVAANPYTELETDDNGEIVQYFYGIYDFGYGPLNVSDIKIGDTSFNDYFNAYYRFVDPNRPDIDVGDWDKDLSKTFEYYKGDVNQIDVSATLNVNENDVGADPSEYQTTRSADDGGDGDRQEITVMVAFPGGLTTYATNGSRADRTVELSVQFAEEGTENWQAFNDENYVESWSSVGDITGVSNQSVPMYPLVRNSSFNMLYNNYTILRTTPRTSNEVGLYGETENVTYYTNYYGLPSGSTTFVSSRYINANDYVTYGGTIVGKIKTRTVFDATHYTYTLYNGLPYNIGVFEDTFKLEFSVYTAINATPSPRDVFNLSRSTSGIVTIIGNSAELVYGSLRFTPKSIDQVKIRITRTRSYGGHTFQIRDEMVWASMTTRFDRNPLATTNRHVFLELRIKATDQLNGTINNLSGICSSVLSVYDGTSWNLEETSNPAWVFADLLTGELNKRKIDKSRLDTDSILEWSTFCSEIPTPPPTKVFEQPRFKSCFVLDYNATLQTLINQVTSSAQASLNIINGRYGVLIDKLKTVPVQVFTPRNSVNFNSSRNYADMPHGFKVKYVDGNEDWSIRETDVYVDGYTSLTATEFEELDTFACTNEEQAWRYGRYMLAQAKLRQENITITADFENLVCTRGDFVLVQYDVMKAGGRPARVKDVAGSNIEIDDGFITEGGVDYGYTFRNSNTGVIVTDTMTITSSTTATVDGIVPGIGDLLIWGEVDNITIECLVRAIQPNDDLSAQLQLVEKADAIYDAESTGELPAYSPQISISVDTEVAPPTEVTNLTVLSNTWTCNAGQYLYTVKLDWGTPDGGVVETYEIYVDSGRGYELIDYSTLTEYTYAVNENDLESIHSFKVIGVASNGNKLSLGEVSDVTATPTSKTTAPSDIDGLFANILNETLQLDWRVVSDCDIDHYLIRYSPKLTASWENSIPLQIVDRNTSLCSVQARTGSYYIKAVDWNDNESDIAASVVTSIPELVNLNVIEETNDFPTVTGSKDQVVKLGDALILQEQLADQYYSDGYYYYSEFLDLGDIHEVRLSSLIDAEGYSEDDIMSNWVTLSDVVLMTSARVSEWDVETHYRSTESFNVMSDWVTLSSIDPISEGAQDQWTPWRKFTIGDFTGRIFQFRLKLVSKKPSISPRVFDGVIKADMPDRTVDFNNLTVPSPGLAVVYDPAFAGPGTTPSIQVTQDAAQQGDYFVLSNKTLAGFTINFYDKNNVAVSRQADFSCKGYGRKQTVIL